jgi:hypothetical protein
MIRRPVETTKKFSFLLYYFIIGYAWQKPQTHLSSFSTLPLFKPFEANQVLKLSKVDPQLRAGPGYTCTAFIAKENDF